MTIRVDLDKKEIFLGVTDLSSSDTLEYDYGDSNNLRIRAALGKSLHTERQSSHKTADKNYSSEVNIKHDINVLDFNVTIQGRIDGIYEKEDEIIVEEIKSVFNITGIKHRLENGGFDHYFEQAQYYIWLLKQQSSKKVSGYILFIE